ncbi:hypothetical protein JQN70_16725 [Phycicoccus sp. MQZ13P-5]|uniref:Uncharacterized protein n=2 Tax=Phycicoccus sonneratiae TaxID=2807628 RepID=A0ABS2CQD3_9MICO|nr:hypothetical protein [Phycicoccus sonneraticus]MBM6402045.1 hypothetical protein [Phycicoccus sonneraticus]
MEASLNNAADDPFGSLSLLGAPLYGLVTALQSVPEIAGKPIFLLLDEYENLQDYQQRIVNTLVRHAGDTRLTYKVGVRELGLRQHGTLAEEEFISEPADYASIDIARRLVADDFSRFAQEVCGARLSVLAQALSIPAVGLEELFPTLSEADEAILLGAERRVNQALSRMPQTELSASALREFQSLPLAEQWLVVYWQSGHPELRLGDLIADRLQRTKEWENRKNNYLYASLFTLSTGRGAAKKRYAGWDLLCSVSEGNVRYLLQILEAALRSSIGEKGELPTALSARQQSDALVEVGRKRVYELQGFSNHGRAISRLILALGRLFQVMAAHPEGHAPEVNQFRVTGLEELNPSAEYVREILRAGVMHAALVRFPGDKRRGVSGEVREYDYRPHPIFSAFFQYSHRSKRRLTLTPSQIRSLIETPRKGIDDVLASQNRSPISALDSLPDQLLLLEDFYLDGD